MFRDGGGQVIYVGKALRLRDRLRSYFGPGSQTSPRLAELTRRIADFEFVKAANEVEALVLECNLIKHYRPRYNVRLKDDKNYLYLKLPVTEEFPRVHYTRRIADDGARYFGPYTSAQALRSTVKSLRQLLPFRTCSDEVFSQGRICLDYHIQRCPGPCELRITAADYRARIEQVALFMEGRSGELAQGLRAEMDAAAERLDFETAARRRDQLGAIEKIADRQRVLVHSRSDEDLVAWSRSGRSAYVEVAHVREGRMVGHDGHALEGAAELADEDVLRAFLLQYYASATHVPRSIVLPAVLPQGEEVTAFLSHRRGAPASLHVPRRGRLKALLDQLTETAQEALEQDRIRAAYDHDRTGPMLESLAQALELESPPRRIECFDISNLQGESAVGSMVVFEEGRPSPENYRSFKIRLAEGPNDFAMMREMLQRRFDRLESALRRSAAGEALDRSFASRPDLVIVDGGKGQLGVAVAVLEAAGFADVPVFGLAKEREEVFAPGRPAPIVQEHDSPGLFLLQRIRDEAHRFAITHHRRVRTRRALSSPLDSVEGIGPARKRALLRRFGSLDAIRAASPGELAASGIPARVAARLKELL